MSDCGDPYLRLQTLLHSLEPGEKIRIPKCDLPLAPYPTWRRSIGYPIKGAVLRQFRDGCYHIHDAGLEWVLHRDRHNPHDAFFSHLYHDCRGAFWLMTGLVAASVVAAAGVTVRTLFDG
ncbi:MAG TPA: hypothetical protein VNZ52_05985 [Candidatus Thermoplasmatota archaeon]|nr:hypothetical protein [Candidatus Thermoplasmatota archaeon]